MDLVPVNLLYFSFVHLFHFLLANKKIIKIKSYLSLWGIFQTFFASFYSFLSRGFMVFFPMAPYVAYSTHQPYVCMYMFWLYELAHTHFFLLVTYYRYLPS